MGENCSHSQSRFSVPERAKGRARDEVRISLGAQTESQFTEAPECTWPATLDPQDDLSAPAELWEVGNKANRGSHVEVTFHRA